MEQVHPSRRRVGSSLSLSLSSEIISILSKNHRHLRVPTYRRPSVRPFTPRVPDPYHILPYPMLSRVATLARYTLLNA